MIPKLTDVEIRVLGVLIEKSLTQAGSYPLTMNAIVLGANQKQNREPVVEYSEGDVARALQTLHLYELAKQAPPDAGARANRFMHNVVERCGWDRREQAVLAELMLRDRQTAGELRTRGSRMTPIEDMAAVTGILQGLMHGDPPVVEELPREPGRSTNRFRHLLFKGDVATSGAPAPTLPEPQASACAGSPQPGTFSEFEKPRGLKPAAQEEAPRGPGEAGLPAPAAQSDDELSSRVARLEARVDELTYVILQLRENTGA